MITKFKIFEADYLGYEDDWSWGVHARHGDYGDYGVYGGEERPKPTYKKTDKDKIRSWKEESIDFFFNYTVYDFIDLLQRKKIYIDKNDNEILEYSVIENELELFKEVMKYQKMNLTFDDNYLILKSVRNKNIEFVKELLKYKSVDPSANNNVSIRTASDNGSVEIVKELLKDARIDPTLYNNYALIQSIKNKHIEVANLLLDDDRVHPASFSLDPLLYALSGHHEDLVNRIISYKGVLKIITFNHLVAYKELFDYTKRNPDVLKYIKLTDEEKRKIFPVYKSRKFNREI